MINSFGTRCLACPLEQLLVCDKRRGCECSACKTTAYFRRWQSIEIFTTVHI
ncbi:hypothetical protein BJX66DRAFT_296301 [Aspergillus keveii]|uniref:Transposase zinc-binding domain-containing protein n=1 Tax=Aspergillus keveii TaxID=714993 RepID=A0ABR4GG70_9EURO